MYEVKTFTKQLDMSNIKDLAAYSAIINDPLCTIVSIVKEKLTEKEMDGEGNASYIKERIVQIITWQQKCLLED